MKTTKVVPVEPTQEMLVAMQQTGIRSIKRELNSPTYSGISPYDYPRSVWQAAIDAAPDSQEDDHPQPDHSEVMGQALEALETAQPYVADYCKESIVTPHNDAIAALRAALGEK